MTGFWTWFEDNEERLFCFRSGDEGLLDEVGARLAAVDEDLTFEFGPVVEGRREFVVSAGGHKRAFPVVEALCREVPPLSRWTVMPFRPRRATISIVEMKGRTLHPDAVEVVLLHNQKQAGLYVFVPGYAAGDNTLGQMVYLMLDEALGEYIMETEVALIKLFPFEEVTEGERVRMPDLPRHFDDLMRRLGRPTSG